MTEHEQDIVNKVEEYVQAATGQHGSPTMQTRRVVAALKEIGIKRSGFRARTIRERDGTYGSCVGSVWDRPDMRRVIDNSRILALCGLDVHILDDTPGKESAFVASRSGCISHIFNHVWVGSGVRDIKVIEVERDE